MTQKSKKLLFIALGVIILLVAIIGIYAVSRRVALNNNEILLNFKQNNPEVYTSENSDITYYEYDCDHGHVICQYEPSSHHCDTRRQAGLCKGIQRQDTV